MTRLDFEIKLHKLCSIRLNHTYYDDGRAKDLSIIPTPATEKYLRDHYLTFKSVQIDNFVGALIYFDPVLSPIAFGKQDLSGEKLSFCIVNRNPAFTYFTQIPFLKHNETLYFHNLSAPAAKNSAIALHDSDRVAQDHPKVQLVTPVFMYQLKAAPTTKPSKAATQEGLALDDIQLQDSWGNSYQASASGIFYAPNPKSKKKEEAPKVAQMQHPIDVSDLPSGQYTIKPQSKHFEEASIYSLHAWDYSYVAMVDIFLSPKDAKIPKLVSSKASQQEASLSGQDYSITFAARETYWRYFIMENTSRQEQVNGGQFHTHEIHDVTKGNGNLQFGKPEQVVLKDKPLDEGTKAVQLISKKPIAFEELSNRRLELHAQKNGLDPKVKRKLPFPAPHKLKAAHELGEGEYYSDVYFYIS